LPFALSYRAAAAFLLGAAVTALALALIVRGRSTPRIAAAGVLLGLGIVVTHHQGMKTLTLTSPLPYDSLLMTLAALTAIAASIASLWIAIRLPFEHLWSALLKKVGSSVILGFGLVGAEYAGLAAAHIREESLTSTPAVAVAPPVAAAVVAASTLLLLLGGLFIYAYDEHRAAVLAVKDRENKAKLTRLQADLARLSRHLVQVQDNERRELAMDIHDLVAQDLFAVQVELALVKKRLPQDAGEDVWQSLAMASETLASCLEETRRMLNDLRPLSVEDVPIAGALRSQGVLHARRAGVAVTVDVDESVPAPSSRVGNQLLRIYLEALSNAARHSGASSVAMTLMRKGSQIVLRVVDNGRGFDQAGRAQRAERAGWGLLIMGERAEAIGAHLNVDSAPGRGTTVEFVIPEQAWSQP
jgi:signal transduction histidine kinase